MRAKLVFEKFEEKSDPIHDMGIGDPLHIAGEALRRYAEEHGYEFSMKPVSGVESPNMIVDLPQPYFMFWDGYMKPGACYINKIQYTITHMPHRAPYIYSLRIVWIGYTSGKTDKDFQILKRNMKSGNVKLKNLEQRLMGRFTKDQISFIIQKIDKNIQREFKKK